MSDAMHNTFGALTDVGQTVEMFLAIWGFLTTIVVTCKKVIHYFRKGKRAKKILSFSNGKGATTLASYPPVGNVRFSHNSALEVNALNILKNFMKEAGYQTVDYDSNSEECNVIHLGGPAANRNVCTLFTALSLNFKYCTSSSERAIYEERSLCGHCIKYQNSSKKCFEIGTRTLELEEGKQDYAILIRIPRNPRRGVSQTTHVLFGAWDSGTLIAVKELTHLDKKVIRKYGKNRKYCIVIPIRDDVAIPNEWMDCTEDLFGRE